MSVPLIDRYAAMVRAGTLERDAHQVHILEKLDALSKILANYAPPRRAGSLGRLLGGKPNGTMPAGLYIWGDVGRGKTMLMDLFFAGVPVARKQRVHFHAFMADIHARIHARRGAAQRGANADDPIAAVADEVSGAAILLCFDEFHVTDIVDAMILGRLFAALFERGVVIVATSNVPPDRLYEDGLNRALFLPFIALIESRMEVARLDARTDFRLEKLEGMIVYHVPPNAKSAAALEATFKALTGMAHGTPQDLDVLGRKIRVPEAHANVARFSYADLCEQPLGPADFLVLARAFHTILVDGLKIIGAAQRNEAKRFMTLIDTLYDRHVKLIVSAETEPAGLYLGTEGREAFEFQRTVSRLIEMRSAAYLALPHGEAASFGSGNASGLVET